MSSEPDLLVVGAGPAGMGAALAASAHGVGTLLVDMAPAAGGQIYRAGAPGFQPVAGATADVDAVTGNALRERLAASAVVHVAAHQVWSAGSDLRIDALGAEGPLWWRPRAIVAATGTTERVVPFPGWTEPGVIGLAAATILLKSQHMLPGTSTVVAGCGPLLLAVAYKVLLGGGRVSAVVDLSTAGDWLRGTASMLARPADLLRGVGWLRELRAAGVPLMSGRAVSCVRNAGGRLLVETVAVDARRRPVPRDLPLTLEADCLAIGHGLVPATELSRALGAAHVFEAAAGGWVPVIDDSQRSTRKGLYAAGDCTGIQGAAAAFEAGRIAGLTVALDQQRITPGAFRRLAAKSRRALASARRFGAASARLMALQAGQVDAIDADTVVCRCEDVTRAEVDAALESGAVDVNQLKSWTRCGMGPCQGRMCGDTVAAIVAGRLGSRDAAGIWTARAPLRPLDLETLTGSFEYADIPLPQAAPL